MFKSNELSIAKRLTWMNMLVSGVALLVACAAFIGYDVTTFRTVTLRNLSVRAQVIGSNSVSALLFNDPESAANTLAFKADPQILSAIIYTPDGQPFASYIRPDGDRVPPPPAIGSTVDEVNRIQGTQIVLARHIVSDGKVIGIVYISSDVEALDQRLKLFVGIAALVLLASMLAALVVSSAFRRSVAKPIVDLADVAKTVSQEKNYSMRVDRVDGQGEVTILIDAFNEMMAEIEEGEHRLQRAHDALEQRVQERTADLVAAQKEVEAYSKVRSPRQRGH